MSSMLGNIIEDFEENHEEYFISSLMLLTVTKYKLVIHTQYSLTRKLYKINPATTINDKILGKKLER